MLKRERSKDQVVLNLRKNAGFMNTLIKEPIEVNKQAFAKAVEVYGNKLQAIKNIKDEVRMFIPKARIDDSFLDDVMNNFYELLLVKYQKQNTLNLRAEKLAELLEFDLSNLYNTQTLITN